MLLFIFTTQWRGMQMYNFLYEHYKKNNPMNIFQPLYYSYIIYRYTRMLQIKRIFLCIRNMAFM